MEKLSLIAEEIEEAEGSLDSTKEMRSKVEELIEVS